MLSSQHIRFFLAISILTTLLLALALTSKLGTSNVLANPQEERQLESVMPKHIPLLVNIRKEKEKQFKDLENERWTHDFELEVTNTGDKPILRILFDAGFRREGWYWAKHRSPRLLRQS
jgi:hypothetical protein